MFIFHCHACKETFQIALENLADRQNIICQNCGQPFPEQAVANLQKLGRAYRDAIDNLKSTNYRRHGWSISIAGNPNRRPGESNDHAPSTPDNPPLSFWEEEAKREKSTIHFTKKK
ncbi:hypothetical protein SCACP_30540 [Sporomusa carbonis]